MVASLPSRSPPRERSSSQNQLTQRNHCMSDIFTINLPLPKPPKPGRPTARQLVVLTAIQRHHDKTLLSPTYRDLARALGIRLYAVVQHVMALERRGLIVRQKGLS